MGVRCCCGLVATVDPGVNVAEVDVELLAIITDPVDEDDEEEEELVDDDGGRGGGGAAAPRRAAATLAPHGG